MIYDDIPSGIRLHHCGKMQHFQWTTSAIEPWPFSIVMRTSLPGWVLQVLIRLDHDRSP